MAINLNIQQVILVRDAAGMIIEASVIDADGVGRSLSLEELAELEAQQRNIHIFRNREGEVIQSDNGSQSITPEDMPETALLLPMCGDAGGVMYVDAETMNDALAYYDNIAAFERANQCPSELASPKMCNVQANASGNDGNPSLLSNGGTICFSQAPVEIRTPLSIQDGSVALVVGTAGAPACDIPIGRYEVRFEHIPERAALAVYRRRGNSEVADSCLPSAVRAESGEPVSRESIAAVNARKAGVDEPAQDAEPEEPAGVHTKYGCTQDSVSETVAQHEIHGGMFTVPVRAKNEAVSEEAASDSVAEPGTKDVETSSVAVKVEGEKEGKEEAQVSRSREATMTEAASHSDAPAGQEFGNKSRPPRLGREECLDLTSDPLFVANATVAHGGAGAVMAAASVERRNGADAAAREYISATSERGGRIGQATNHGDKHERGDGWNSEEQTAES